MAHVYPVKRQCFRNNFCAVAEDITKVLSSIRSASYNGHLMTWYNFFVVVALENLLVSYQDLFPNFNAFVQQCLTISISPSGHVVCASKV